MIFNNNNNKLKSLLDSRVTIRKGMPSSKKMKEGQAVFCKIDNDIYNVIKHKDKLYRLKYAQVSDED